MKRKGSKIKAQTLIILIGMILCLSSCDLFKKEKEQEVTIVEVEKVQVSETTQNIAKLLDNAARSTDDNEKAKLLGASSDLLMKKGDTKKAVDIARQALVANPTQKLALCVLAEYSISHRQLKEAFDYLEDAKRSDAKFARAYYLSGNAYYLKKDLKQAEANYKKAIELDKKEYSAYTNLAGLYSSKKQNDKALAIMQRLLEVEPGFALHYKNAGITAEKAGKKKEAKEYYEKYLTLNPYGNDKERIKQWMAKL